VRCMSGSCTELSTMRTITCSLLLVAASLRWLPSDVCLCFTFGALCMLTSPDACLPTHKHPLDADALDALSPQVDLGNIALDAFGTACQSNGRRQGDSTEPENAYCEALHGILAHLRAERAQKPDLQGVYQHSQPFTVRCGLLRFNKHPCHGEITSIYQVVASESFKQGVSAMQAAMPSGRPITPRSRSQMTHHAPTAVAGAPSVVRSQAHARYLPPSPVQSSEQKDASAIECAYWSCVEVSLQFKLAAVRDAAQGEM
jgi:hypothetical protein